MEEPRWDLLNTPSHRSLVSSLWNTVAPPSIGWTLPDADRLANEANRLGIGDFPVHNGTKRG